jgi:hypothetical protein
VVFWLVMTVISSLGSVAYAGTYAFGERLGIGRDRRNRFGRSAILFIGWALVCFGHYATR